MRGDSSAYAALGLDPGADAAAVEQAYRKLIKKHHPDRQGGDAKRAAEINRAYRELRPAPSQFSNRELLELNDDVPLARHAFANRWILAAIGVAASIAALLLAAAPISSIDPGRLSAIGSRLEITGAAGATIPSDLMNAPLAFSAIDSAVAEAQHLKTTSDEMGFTQASVDCNRKLRASPSTEQLDRCAAFDDAVVQLEDRDPLRDKGPFSELAVTGRQWSAASSLSSDYLAIDGRLDRIRQRVEAVLAPSLPPVSD